MASNRKAITVLQEPFQVDPAYEFVKELGAGAYGWVQLLQLAIWYIPEYIHLYIDYCLLWFDSLVCAARNNQTGDSVAIKKVGGGMNTDI